MTESVTSIRNKISHGLYTNILKPIFFRNDPEVVHDHILQVGKTLGKTSFGRGLTKAFFDYQNPLLTQTVCGIRFKNPIGLSAGFDKNAELTDILPSVGFGFAEVGSVTGTACAGNAKPRLWRLKKSKSLVVYYGLKNDGCEQIAARLKHKQFKIPIGVNVAMTNCAENADLERGVQDYAKAFTAMEPIGAFLTVNISCPNAFGGQPFTDPVRLERLLTVLDAIPTEKPVFIKLSPDLSDAELDALLDVARVHRIHGIVCTNLTKKRDNPNIRDNDLPNVGGMSGKVVQELADRMLAYIYKKEGARFVLVGCGGVFSAEDAYRKIRLGATLVEMITGMIFEGPHVISDINQGLAKLLARDGFATITDAIGADNK